MNIQFSFRRFWHILVWTLVYQMRQLLTLFGVAIFAFATFELFACIQARNSYEYNITFMHGSESYLINIALRDIVGECMVVGERGPDSHAQQVAKHEGYNIKDKQYRYVDYPSSHELFQI